MTRSILNLIVDTTFGVISQMFFEDNIDDDKYCGHLFGLGASFVQNNGNSSYEQHQGYGPPTSTTIVNAPALGNGRSAQNGNASDNSNSGTPVTANGT